MVSRFTDPQPPSMRSVIQSWGNLATTLENMSFLMLSMVLLEENYQRVSCDYSSPPYSKHLCDDTQDQWSQTISTL